MSTYAAGVCYLRGHGTDKDKEKGIQFLTKASEKGVKEATEMLKNKYCLDGDIETANSIAGDLFAEIIKNVAVNIIGGGNED